MTTSLVNTAVSAIITALQTTPAVATQIDRVRLRPLAANVTAAVVVRPLKSEVAEAAMSPGAPIRWSTHIAVECYARATPGTAPDAAVDSLLVSVYARLMADPSLGGALLGLQPSDVEFDFDADGDQVVCASFLFRASSRCAASSFSS